MEMEPSLEAAHPAPSSPPPLSYGEQWANAFGICIQRDGVTFDRSRYAFLKEKLVFKMDAVVGNSDPLTAFMEHQEQQQQLEDGGNHQKQAPAVRSVSSVVPGSINWDSDDEEDDDDDDRSDEAPKEQGDAANGEDGRTSSPPHSAGWAQYFSDETLLYEINTDLERLYPAGNETLFQNKEYRGILRHVLFVWCKLHPDVSYRQGMHDVAAMVLYAFLVKCGGDDTADGDGDTENESSNPFSKEGDAKKKGPTYQLPEFAEADTFLVFEAIMLYLKPFYEIAQTPPRGEENGNHDGGDEVANHATGSSSSSHGGEPRLFGNYSLKENDDPNNTLFGDSLMPISSYSLTSSGGKKKKQQPPLNRICGNIQYELLQQKDPQLYYHLQNLDIVPETYCLRWIRLLLAREFEFDELLQVWDAIIQDRERPDINFPHASKEEDYLHNLPSLANSADDKADDLQWVGFPLLRYLCVAKLLTMSKQLRSTDNTGCWRLLMQTAPSEDSSSVQNGQKSAKELIRFAQVLRNPMLGYREGPEGIDIVEFQAGSLGIILTAAKAPFEDRLAVKAFVDDPQARSGLGVGQAQASGKVVIGDILHSINGVPIVGVTTEEVKRHIQLIGRPMYMGFFHAATISSALEGFAADGEAALPSQGGHLTPERVGTVDTSIHFLPGELCYAHVETSIQNFVLSHDGSCLSHYLSGKLYITNYRCFFTRLLGKGDIDWQIPVLSISSVDGMDNGSSLSGTAMDHAQAVLGFMSDDIYKVVIRCKDTQVVRLSFSNHSEYSKLYKCLSCLAFPVSLLDAFCFAYSPTIAPSEEVPFDIRREYQRIGLLDFPDRLRCIDQSPRYDLCDTYPQHLIVPSAMSDVRIKAAAAFRSHARLPVVSWIHRGNGATISRSSQPLVGLKSARSMDDELLVRLLCVSSSNNDCSYGRYVIMDARGQLAAVGNKAMGKGTEIISNYRGGKLVFMNIDNIHAIRTSFQSLTSVFEPRKGANEDSSSFYSKIESSGWLRHVRLVLKASSELAHSIHNGVSVLTHCSDGWDRTAQMVSLAEMMLDPYYRTLRGFQCLVEKEWCSFGHQFGSRCGHARSDATNDQRSPVFLMWLDCVWQFIRQFPSECEFNEKFLITLADHLFSCKYGTFMFDCERQRKEIFTKHRVFSIWSELNSNSDLFTNQLFAPSEQIPLLTPSTLSKNINALYPPSSTPTPTPAPPALVFHRTAQKEKRDMKDHVDDRLIYAAANRQPSLLSVTLERLSLTVSHIRQHSLRLLFLLVPQSSPASAKFASG